MEIGAEPKPPTEGTTGVTNTDDTEDQPETTRYMQGWALASLTLAFMSTCLVLAIDNTILCLSFSVIRLREHQI